jgi:hypothetical protein
MPYCSRFTFRGEWCVPNRILTGGLHHLRRVRGAAGVGNGPHNAPSVSVRRVVSCPTPIGHRYRIFIYREYITLCLSHLHFRLVIRARNICESNARSAHLEFSFMLKWAKAVCHQGSGFSRRHLFDHPFRAC